MFVYEQETFIVCKKPVLKRCFLTTTFLSLKLYIHVCRKLMVYAIQAVDNQSLHSLWNNPLISFLLSVGNVTHTLT